MACLMLCTPQPITYNPEPLRPPAHLFIMVHRHVSPRVMKVCMRRARQRRPHQRQQLRRARTAQLGVRARRQVAEAAVEQAHVAGG